VFREDILAGQAGVVTGGGSGIGHAIVARLVGLGAAVTVTGRNEDKLARVADELGVTVARGDVRDPEHVQTNMATHIEAHGRLDFLINNAAGNFLCPLDRMSPNAFSAVLDIVAKGTFLMSQAAYPHLTIAGGGSIVNIGTTYSWSHAAWVAHSGAAKAAVLNLTRTMAVEWGPHGIRTNVVAPGPIRDTEGFKRLSISDTDKTSKGLVPLGRAGDPVEIAHLVAFLLSPMGAYINGAAIPVDGGAHLAVPGLLPVGADVPEELLRPPKDR